MYQTPRIRFTRRFLFIAGSIYLAVTVFVSMVSGQSDPSGTAMNASKDQRAAWTPEQRDAWAAVLRERYTQSPEQWPDMTVDEAVETIELGLLPPAPHPADNPHNEAKEELGRLLFYDPRLSATDQMACASCHDPDLGWADGRSVAFGHSRKELKRNTPTAQNAGYLDLLFWDGRADTLEQLVINVIENNDELNTSGEAVAAKLRDVPEYREQFEAAFGDDGVDSDRIAKAIATFVRTNTGGRSAFDAFLRGRRDALSPAQIRGLHLFRTDARCMNCHHGPTMSDSLLHNTGLHNYGRPFEDLGQYRITQNPEDVGKFRTPMLRNIAETAPYMHHGLFEDLTVTLRAYNIGMPTPKRRADQVDDPLYPEKSPLLNRLDLSDEDLADIEAFLESLTEPHRRIRPPELPGLHEG